MKIVFLALVLLTVNSVLAGTAKVVTLKGKATFMGKPIKQNAILEGVGEINVNDKSYLKLQLSDSGTTIVVGANSVTTMNFNEPPENQELNLVRGAARWVSGKIQGKGVRTHNVLLGIRGTDIFVSYNNLLTETEVICFDGQILMTNWTDKSDYKIITKGQWGGIGGRFGEKIANVLDLSPDLLKAFDASLAK